MKPLLALLLFFPLLQACNLFCGRDVPEEEHLRRTVLVYWAAQNSLGASGYQQRDSAELAQGMRYLREGERLLLFMDDAQPPRLYELALGYQKPKLLRRWKDDVNSASSATLREVLQWMRQSYPSDSYGLVLASHATGWIPSPKSAALEKVAPTAPFSSAPLTRHEALARRKSYGMDVGLGGNMQRDVAALGRPADEMDLEELATALRESGVHPRFILLDCCLMQNIEVLYALRNTTDYIMASPIAISAEGGPYTQLMQRGLFSEDITDLGHSYMQHYQQQFEHDPDAFGLVTSIVRTDRVADIATALSAVLPAATQDEEGKMEYWKMDKTQKYATLHAKNFYRPHYYDLNDALRRQLAPEAYARVKAAIDAAIVFKGATARFYSPPGYFSFEAVDLDHYCGISMFVPQQAYADVAGRSLFGDLNHQFRKTAWYQAAGWQAKGW